MRLYGEGAHEGKGKKKEKKTSWCGEKENKKGRIYLHDTEIERKGRVRLYGEGGHERKGKKRESNIVRRRGSTRVSKKKKEKKEKYSKA